MEAATYWAINRMVRTCVQPRIQATGLRDRVTRVKEDKCERKIEFLGSKGGEVRSLRVLVNEGVKHRENGGETKGIIWKNRRE